MPFKIKDLMISDFSEGAQRAPDETCRPVSRIICFPAVSLFPCTLLTYPHWPTITCGACTPITGGPWTLDTCGACTVITRGACTACTVVTDIACTNVSCGGYTWEGTKAKDAGTSSAASFAALSILKEQLKQQLAEVEKEQAAVEESLLPQTVEQVDELSKKLTEALQELKVIKQKLSRKPKSAGGK
jgi:hypothetical protein